MFLASVNCEHTHCLYNEGSKCLTENCNLWLVYRMDSRRAHSQRMRYHRVRNRSWRSDFGKLTGARSCKVPEDPHNNTVGGPRCLGYHLNIPMNKSREELVLSLTRCTILSSRADVNVSNHVWKANSDCCGSGSGSGLCREAKVQNTN
jgi:hypothetical protein